MKLYSRESIDEVIKNFVENHEDVKAAYAQLIASKEGQIERYGLLFPLVLKSSSSYTYPKDNSLEDEITQDVYFTYSFFTPGINGKKEKEEKLILASELYYHSVKKKVLYEIIKLIISYEEARKYYSILENKNKSSIKFLEISERRFNLGDIPKTEYEFSLMKKSSSEVSRINGEMNYKYLRSEIERQLNIDLSLNIFLLDFINEDYFRVPLPEEILEIRNDFKQTSVLIDLYDDEIEAAKTSYIPELSLQGGAYDISSKDEEYKLSLALAFPISKSKSNIYKQKRFSIEKDAAILRQKALLMRTISEIERISNSIEYYKRMKVSLEEAIGYAKKTLESMLVEYKSGYNSIYNYLNAEKDYYALEEKLASIEILLKKAKLDYYYHTGGLSIEKILK